MTYNTTTTRLGAGIALILLAFVPTTANALVAPTPDIQIEFKAGLPVCTNLKDCSLTQDCNGDTFVDCIIGDPTLPPECQFAQLAATANANVLSVACNTISDPPTGLPSECQFGQLTATANANLLSVVCSAIADPPVDPGLPPECQLGQLTAAANANLLSVVCSTIGNAGPLPPVPPVPPLPVPPSCGLDLGTPEESGSSPASAVCDALADGSNSCDGAAGAVGQVCQLLGCTADKGHVWHAKAECSYECHGDQHGVSVLSDAAAWVAGSNSCGASCFGVMACNGMGVGDQNAAGECQGHGYDGGWVHVWVACWTIGCTECSPVQTSSARTFTLTDPGFRPLGLVPGDVLCISGADGVARCAAVQADSLNLLRLGLSDFAVSCNVQDCLTLEL